MMISPEIEVKLKNYEDACKRIHFNYNNVNAVNKQGVQMLYEEKGMEAVDALLTRALKHLSTINWG